MSEVLFAILGAAATIVGVVAILRGWEADEYRALWIEAENDLDRAADDLEDAADELTDADLAIAQYQACLIEILEAALAPEPQASENQQASDPTTVNF